MLGVLFVNSPLDFETRNDYILSVRATDLVTSLWSSATVKIQLLDKNDCPPR